MSNPSPSQQVNVNDKSVQLRVCLSTQMPFSPGATDERSYLRCARAQRATKYEVGNDKKQRQREENWICLIMMALY